MSRFLTSLVQLFLVSSVVFLSKIMWHDLKNDFKKTFSDLKN